MKKMILAQLLILIISTIVFAQENSQRYEEEAKQRKSDCEQREADLQQILKQSNTARILKAKLDAGNYKMISEVASANDKSLVPYLRWIVKGAKQITYDSSDEFQAQIVLIKLGDEQTFNSVVAELDSDNYYLQDAAVRKLANAGTKASFRKLYELLDRTTKRNVSISDDGLSSSISDAVIYELQHKVKDPPRSESNSIVNGIQLWKDWFEKHKELIE